MRIARTLVALATAGLVALGGLVAPGAPPASAATKDHDVVFLVDGSGSIDATDWTLQLQGFAAALQDRVNFPLNGSMSVSVVQWAAGAPRVEIPLTNLDSKAALENVVATVSAIRQMNSGTSPGDGIRAGANELALNGRSDAQRTLCMSTDGERNGGEALASATAYAKTKSVDKYTVVAIEDGAFKAASATSAYGPYVFGGGTVTTARTTAEFTSLISGCVAESSTLEALEVTQSIQDLENTVPLVETKATVVRAYLSTDGDPQSTSGRLRGFRGGVELPGSPLAPLNGGTKVYVNDDYLADRASMSSTLNFELPFEWRSGTVELSVELPGGVSCAVTGAGSLPCAEKVTFGAGMEYDLQYRGFYWTLKDAHKDIYVKTATTYDQLIEQHERAAGQMPVGSVDRKVLLGMILVDEPSTLSVAIANGLLNLADLARDPLDEVDLQRWYGALPGDTLRTTDFGGVAYGNSASGWLGADRSSAYVGYGRNRVVHELGHTFGRHHTVNADENGPVSSGWCGEYASPRAPNWQYWQTTTRDGVAVDIPTLSSLSNPRLATWGMDTRSLNRPALALSDPSVVTPLMSYCDPANKGGQWRWITPEDYLHLLGDDLDPISGGFDASDRAGASEALVIRGLLDPATSTIELQPALAFAAAFTPSDPGGTHEIAVLDDQGVALYTAKFTPLTPEGDPTGPGDTEPMGDAAIHLVIPADLVGAKSLRISAGTAVLWSEEMSATAPTVSIDTPATGTAEDLHVTWSSQDADGDALTHTLLYSSDSGTTWDLIAADLSSTSAEISRWALPASNHARIKVIVSDGLRSTEAISEEFTLPNLSPNVAITDPIDDTTVSGSQSFAMDAQIYDAEDGELEGASVVWTSDRNGKLGTGSRLLKRADELAEGTHVLTVTVTDSGGAKTSQSVTVHVNRVDVVPADPSTCSVNYQVHGTSPGAFTAQVTLTNTGPDTIDGWSLAWKGAAGEAVTNQWSSDITTGPSEWTATNLSWNRTVAPGGTVTFGFNGSIAGDGTPAVPDEFFLNGGRCL